MHAPGRLRARRPWLPIVGAAIAVALVCAVAAWRPWTASSVPVAGADSPAVAAAAPAPLALPDGARVLIFGDSWVYGSAAIVPTLGFAYRISETEGWDTVIDGVRGSGYLKTGIDGGTYGERIGALDPALDPDLVIVEGSINDRRLPASGYREAVTAVWDALQDLYPDARIVVLGPAPQVLPVEEATARIDGDLAELAAARGWWYISPIAEDWITPENYAELIDNRAGRDHPSTSGHAYLANRLAAVLDTLAGGAEVVADAPLDDELVAP
ncbi:SGNH/GDSL hydrolase family protein [Microbacterium pumilum]|uniref:SGNH hydrolase-type esterase domain-containing protein n=1 Tax=Microbacterium pumilum TaxID=344165 RepID=A0ABN2SFE5_9MICO